MLADMISNKTHSPIVTELFIRGGKLNISVVFLFFFKQSFYTISKYQKILN